MKKVYLFDIDEESGKGVFNISHVEDPAIESNFIAFSKDENLEDTMKFSIDDEKMRLAGPILIANKEMYRKDLDGYVMFSAEGLEKARASYKKNNNNFALNIEHSDKKAPSFVLEDWITEPGISDKSQKWNFSNENPTWYGVIQVTDKDYWRDFIKTGKVKGFSIEIDKSSIKTKEKFNMENTTEKETTQNVEKFGKVELADGKIIYWDGDGIDVGTKVFLDEAMSEMAPDGEHVDASGNVVVVKEGAVVEIRKKVEVEMAEETTTDAKPNVEFLTKEEATQMISDITTRLEALELKLNEKEKEVEVLSKELKEAKEAKIAKSFTFKTENKAVVKQTEMTFSQQFKERLKKEGKL